MTSDKPRICLIAFPVEEAFMTPFSNLRNILSSLSSELHMITGSEGGLDVDYDLGTHIKQRLRPSKNLICGLARYAYMQMMVSLALVRVSRKVDVCIFFMEQGAPLPLITAKALRKKIVWALPSSIDVKYYSPNALVRKLLGWLRDLNYRLVDRLVLYSENLISAWNLDKHRAKVRIAHEHYLDLNPYPKGRPVDQREDVVGYVGRLCEEKGVPNFVRAIPEILKQQSSIRFVIGGDGPLRESIEQLLAAEISRGHVRLVGWIPHEELPRHLREFKLMVVPSHTEGLPNVMLEAMACGTPVLATPVGAVPDVITIGRTGFILQNNSPESIAREVLGVLEHPQLESVAKDARIHVEREFTFERAVERYAGLLKNM